jgi:hypothetical protein
MQDGPRYLTSTDLNTVTTTQLDSLGACGVTGDGRRFRYTKFGGTSAVTSGKLLVAKALETNSTGLAVPAAGSSGQTTANLSSGSLQLVVTNGATAVTSDEFAEGYLEILGTNGIKNYKIRGNTADSSGSAAITVYLSEPLTNTSALANGTNTVNLTRNPYDSPTASLTQGLPVGWTVVGFTNSSTVTNYGWVLTRGLVFCAATSGTKGYPVTQDLSGTAGYVAVTGSGAAETVPTIGVFKESAASSTAPVWALLD